MEYEWRKKSGKTIKFLKEIQKKTPKNQFSSWKQRNNKNINIIRSWIKSYSLDFFLFSIRNDKFFFCYYNLCKNL